MRTAKVNQQKLYYSLLVGEQPVYVLDDEGNPIVDYIDEEGNQYLRETGQTELVYSEPVSFFASVSFSGGEAQAQEYGIDVGQYDAVMVLAKGQIPISETSIIHMDNQNGDTDDFKVLSIKPSLNYERVILGRLVK